MFAPDDARAGDRSPRLRASRSDPRSGARAGPHAAPPRGRLPRGRPRAALRQARRRGGLLHQLRLREPRAAGAHAPASERDRPCRRRTGLARGAPQEGEPPARVRARARRRPSARGRRPLRARQGAELLGWVVQRHDTNARCDALPRPLARRASRRRGPNLCRARARTYPDQRRRASRRSSRRRRSDLCAAPEDEPALLRASPPFRGSAMERGPERRAPARQGAARARASRRSRLVLAGGGGSERRERRRSRFGSSLRSTRSFKIGRATSSFGDGSIDSRLTRPRRSAGSAITRCRCSGATPSSAGRTSR